MQMQYLKNKKVRYSCLEILKLIMQFLYVKYWNIYSSTYKTVQTSTKGGFKTSPVMFPAKKCVCRQKEDEFSNAITVAAERIWC